jgi:hypothetical protein
MTIACGSTPIWAATFLGRLRVRELPTGALILEAADETRLDESA